MMAEILQQQGKMPENEFVDIELHFDTEKYGDIKSEDTDTDPYTDPSNSLDYTSDFSDDQIEARPPRLVNKYNQHYDIDISSTATPLSYWALPFSRLNYKGDNERCLMEYEDYISRDNERLYHLVGLSGQRLGCSSKTSSHGVILLHLFKTMTLTQADYNS